MTCSTALVVRARSSVPAALAQRRALLATADGGFQLENCCSVLWNNSVMCTNQI